MGQGDFVYTPSATVSNPLTLTATTPASQPTPAAGSISIGQTLLVGRPWPYWLDDVGSAWLFQPSLYDRDYCLWTVGTSNNPGRLGDFMATSDSSTATAPAPATTNQYTIRHRQIYTSVAAVNRSAGIISNSDGLHYWRGNAANKGGFWCRIRFGIDTLQAAMVAQIGMSSLASSSPTTNNNPSSVAQDFIGLLKDTGDASLTITVKDNTTATKSIGGLAITPANSSLYDLYIACKPNDTLLSFRVDDLIAGTTLIDSTTNDTHIPRNTILMGPYCALGTATGAASVVTAVCSVYCTAISNF